MFIHIVIARYRESIDWINKIPKNFKIFIYNKNNEPLNIFDINENINIINLPNIGREGDTYLHHIITHYDNLPDRIIFTQGDPFPHSPRFLELLDYVDQYKEFQPLTDRWLTNKELPPLCVLNNNINKKHFINNISVIPHQISLYNMQPVCYFDEGAINIYKLALRYLGKTSGTNIIGEFLNKNCCKCLYQSGNYPTVEYYCIAACFGITKELLLKQSKEVYVKLKTELAKNTIVGYILERAWIVLWGGYDNK
jgi:hypothetical protein